MKKRTATTTVIELELQNEPVKITPMRPYGYVGLDIGSDFRIGFDLDEVDQLVKALLEGAEIVKQRIAQDKAKEG